MGHQPGSAPALPVGTGVRCPVGRGERRGWGSRQGGHMSAHPSICPSSHPPIRPFIHPSIHPSICPSIHLSIHSSICPPIRPSIHPSFLPSTHPSIRPSITPSTCPSVHPSVPPNASHPSICPSLPPSTHPPVHLSLQPPVPPSIHSPTPQVDPRPGRGAATIVPEVVAAGCRRVLVAEPGEKCHLPRVTGAMLPWHLVALVLLSPIKAACWPRVQRAAPALGPGSSAGEEPTLGCRTRPCPSPRPKMPRAPQPLSLLVLLVLAATAQGQAGTGPKELQPWLLGLTAVVVFLFIVFVLLLVNRLWQIRMLRWDGDASCTHLGAGGGDPGGSQAPAVPKAGSRVLWGGDPGHRSPPVSPRRKRGDVQDTPGTDRYHHRALRGWHRAPPGDGHMLAVPCAAWRCRVWSGAPLAWPKATVTPKGSGPGCPATAAMPG
ncbi:uncharacterized protein FN964_014520 [Alca torda]